MAADTDMSVMTPTSVTSPAQRTAQAQERAERIRQGIDGQAAVFRDIRDAVTCRDWEALGYGSPADYVEKERIAERWRAADGSQRELVAELRSAGLSQAAVGAAVGITQARVSQLERGKTGHETGRSQDYKQAYAGQGGSGRRGKAAGQSSASRAPGDGSGTETASPHDGQPAGGTAAGTEAPPGDGWSAQQSPGGQETAAGSSGAAGSDTAAAEITDISGDSQGAGQDGAAEEAQEPGLAELKAENARLRQELAELRKEQAAWKARWAAVWDDLAEVRQRAEQLEDADLVALTEKLVEEGKATVRRGLRPQCRVTRHRGRVITLGEGVWFCGNGQDRHRVARVA